MSPQFNPDPDSSSTSPDANPEVNPKAAPTDASGSDPLPSQGWWARLRQFFRSFTPWQELEAAVVGALITGLATLSIAFVNLVNGLNTQLDRPFQIQESLVKTQIMVEEHRQTVLTDYLSTVTELLVKDNSESKEKFGILRALTHAVLQELDAPRKRYVMMVLYDANLIRLNTALPDMGVVDSFLAGANVVGVNLQGLNFRNSDLRKTNLQGANLQQVNLSGSNFQDANLSGADLRSTILDGVNLDGANLTSACYSGRTQFDPNFDPIAAGMQKVSLTEPCTPEIPNTKDTSPTIPTTVSARRGFRAI
jgi:uncharacterized protein YjbI with pentapeptide repeats